MQTFIFTTPALGALVVPPAQGTYTINFQDDTLVHLDHGGVIVGSITPRIPAWKMVFLQNYVHGGFESYVIGGPNRAIQVIASIHDISNPGAIAELKKLDDMAQKIPGIEFVVATTSVSPFKFKQFAETHLPKSPHFKNLIVASAYKSMYFRRFYGPYWPKMPEARGIYVVAPNGQLRYRQIMRHASENPNYPKLIHAIKGLYLSYAKKIS